MHIGWGRIGLKMAAAVGSLAATSSAGTINFESVVTTGLYPSLSLSDSGVTADITRTSGIAFRIDNLGGTPASWGARTLSPFNSPVTADAFNINFIGTVRSVSIEYGDFGFDVGDAKFRVYSGPDGTGTLLNAQSQAWSGSLGTLPPGVFAFGSAATIGSIRFWGEESLAGFPNSLYWDNLRFTDEAPIIPLPQASAMGAAGLGLVAARRRRML